MNKRDWPALGVLELGFISLVCGVTSAPGPPRAQVEPGHGRGADGGGGGAPVRAQARAWPGGIKTSGGCPSHLLFWRRAEWFEFVEAAVRGAVQRMKLSGQRLAC